MANAQRPSEHDDGSDGALRDAQPSMVLFLAANPEQVQALQLGEECRAIEEQIRAGKFRDQIRFTSRWAARPDDLLQALNEETPSVLHFSGHGVGDPGLCFQAEDGSVSHVSADGLAAVLRAAGDSVRVVVLNACYSEVQAETLVAHVPCVVGMSAAIDDDAAIVYAASFYRALAFGKSVANAHQQGLAAMALHPTSGPTRDVQVVGGAPRAPTPRLLSRPDIDPDHVYLVVASEPPAEALDSPSVDRPPVREGPQVTSRPRRRRSYLRLAALVAFAAVAVAAWVVRTGKGRSSRAAPRPFGLVVRLHGPAGPLDIVCTGGTVILDTGTDRRSEKVSNEGQAYFTEIPPSLAGTTVPMGVACDGHVADPRSTQITLEPDKSYYVLMRERCGDHQCDSDETSQTCPADCPAPADAGVDADEGVPNPPGYHGPCTRTSGTVLPEASQLCPRLRSDEPDVGAIMHEAKQKGYTCTVIYRCR